MNNLAQTKVRDDLLNPVSVLASLASDDMTRVEAMIIEQMGTDTQLIPKVARYLLDAGGKRIRPLITVATAHMLGYTGKGHISLASAVEYIHSATLLHDDVVDESELRRGQKPANQIWSNAHSVLVGDFLFARAFMMMVDAGSMSALQVLSQAASIIAEGEVRQLAAIRDVSINRNQYMSIIEAKTAELFAAAARVSPILCGSDKEHAMDQYGRELGLAFQLVDDALDYSGTAHDLGKHTGDDFREGKLTLPVVLAIEAANEEERVFWNRVITHHDQNDGDFQTAINLLEKYGTIHTTLNAARTHARQAIKALDSLPHNIWSDALSALAEFVVERAY